MVGWLVGWGLTALLTQNRLKVPLNPNQPTNHHTEVWNNTCEICKEEVIRKQELLLSHTWHSRSPTRQTTIQALKNWTDQNVTPSSTSDQLSLGVLNAHCPGEVLTDHSVYQSSKNTKGTRMWANAQPDGRPAEHRWRPLFNAAKFGWRPLLDAVQ